MKQLAALIFTVASIAGLASAHADMNCVQKDQIDGFETGDVANSLILDGAGMDKFRVVFRNDCSQLSFADSVSFTDQASDEFCTGDTMNVGDQICMAGSITQIQSH